MTEEHQVWGEINFANETSIFQKSWWLTAEWAHPMWDDYIFDLADLTTKVDDPKMKADKLHPDATHQLWVWACEKGGIEKDDRAKCRILIPHNYNYQLLRMTDEEATKIVTDLMTSIIKKELSPDTDFWRAWNLKFAENAVDLMQRSGDLNPVANFPADMWNTDG